MVRNDELEVRMSSGTRSVGVAIAAMLVLGAGPADALLVVCQKGKKIKLRVDACTAKETQIPASEFGVTGPQGPEGPAGPAGSARAYAVVDPSGPALAAQRTFNFAAVARANTGIYCLTPTPGSGLDPSTGAALVGIEWGASAGSDLLAFVQLDVIPSSCPATDYEVRTYGLPGGVATLSNQVGFTILIP
jgi:hypothetical protein